MWPLKLCVNQVGLSVSVSLTVWFKMLEPAWYAICLLTVTVTMALAAAAATGNFPASRH
jgi:hypothetical protein